MTERDLEIENSMDNLRCSFGQLRQEIADGYERETQGVRWMREGIRVFLDTYGENAPEFIWLNPELRFRTATVSLERVDRSNVSNQDPAQPGWYQQKRSVRLDCLEATPAGNAIWLGQSEILLNGIEASLISARVV